MQLDVAPLCLNPLDVAGCDPKKIAAVPNPEMMLLDMRGGLPQFLQICSQTIEPLGRVARGKGAPRPRQRLLQQGKNGV